jgi:hypothetical protein
MLVSVRFEIVLILIQLVRMSFWVHPTELIGDVGHVESYFGPFGDSQFWCKIGARFPPNVSQAQKLYWTTGVIWAQV